MEHRFQLAFTGLILLFVAACMSYGGSGVTFQNFRAEVKSAAGAGATDCGHVVIGADRSAANCCVATNFVQPLPFSVTFDEQGIDSRVSRGLALDANGTTTVFFYDGDLTGGNRPATGVIYSQTCRNPTLIQNPCSDPVGFPLNCE